MAIVSSVYGFSTASGSPVPPTCSPPISSRVSLAKELLEGLVEDLAVRLSTSAAVVAGDISAMLWNGVSRTPRLSA